MKRLAALLLLAGCASAAPAVAPDALRGCWIERRGQDTITMRWFPKPDGASWHGDELFYRAGEEPAHQGFDVEPRRDGQEFGPGWAICPLDDGLPHGPPCRPLFFGRGQFAGEGAEWMELRFGSDRLALISVTSGQRSALFDGGRDGCD